MGARINVTAGAAGVSRLSLMTSALEPEAILVQELRDELAAAAIRQEHLEAALRSSRRIGMAMGILMQRHQLTDEQAFARLRDASQNRNVKLSVVAEEFIYTGDAADLR